MILVSYRARGSDHAWRAGIAHEGSLVDAAAFRLHRAGDAPGQENFSVRGLLEQGQSYLEEVFVWAQQQFDTGSHLLSLDGLESGPPVPDPDKLFAWA